MPQVELSCFRSYDKIEFLSAVIHVSPSGALWFGRGVRLLQLRRSFSGLAFDSGRRLLEVSGSQEDSVMWSAECFTHTADCDSEPAVRLIVKETESTAKAEVFED